MSGLNAKLLMLAGGAIALLFGFFLIFVLAAVPIDGWPFLASPLAALTFAGVAAFVAGFACNSGPNASARFLATAAAAAGVVGAALSGLCVFEYSDLNTIPRDMPSDYLVPLPVGLMFAAAPVGLAVTAIVMAWGVLRRRR